LVPSLRQLSEGQPAAHQATTRKVNIYYTLKGARKYNPDSLEGNVLTPSTLTSIRNAERRAINMYRDHLRGWKSIVPCFFGQTGEYPPTPLGVLPNGDATDASVRQCLAYIASTTGDALSEYKERLASDFDSAALGGLDRCTSMRTELELAMDADFDTLIREYAKLSGDGIEVTYGGDAWMTFRELYLNLQDDVLWVVVSILAIHLFLVFVLKMPLFGTFSLLIILLCFPVTIAVYTGMLSQEELPILSVVSLYLVLGIGADAVFIFTNTYALNEFASEKKQNDTRIPESPSPANSKAHQCLRLCMPRWKHLPCSAYRTRESGVLGASLRDAIQVSGLSMVTTAVAFGASINSPISTIRQYALFQTICVIVEYLLILGMLVPAMVFYRRRLFQVRRKRPVDFFKDTTTLVERSRTVVKILLLPLRVCLWPSLPSFWRKVVQMMSGARDLVLSAPFGVACSSCRRGKPRSLSQAAALPRYLKRATIWSAVPSSSSKRLVHKPCLSPMRRQR